MILHSFRNGLLMTTFMSQEGVKGAPQTGGARLDSEGNITQIGQVLKVGSEGTVTDISGTGQQTVDRINPATGKEWTLEEQAAKADAAKAGDKPLDATKDPLKVEQKDAPKEGDKPAYVKPPQADIDAYVAEATKIDPKGAPYAKEFIETGTVSEASRVKAVEEFGRPRAQVDQYFDGIQAQAELAALKAGTAQQASEAQIAAGVKTIQAVAGGEKPWGEFVAWANTALPEADMAQITKAIETTSPDIAAIVVQKYVDQYKASGAAGTGPRDLTNGGASVAGPQGGVQGFRSRAEQSAAINDPKYSRDSDYRATVDARMAITTFKN